MAKMIQIRNVPDQMHRKLKARAASEGMSLSDYIKRELGASVKRLTMKEWIERVSRAEPIRSDRSAAELIRELRGQ